MTSATLIQERSPPENSAVGSAIIDPPHPSFSIIMPTFQRRDVVCDASRAIGELKYDGAIEVIIVVDGSTDGSTDALAELALPFPCRIIEQPNQGAAEARNRGAREARNEVLLFLDDDMICEPDLLEEHARMFQAGADAVIGNTPVDPSSPPGFLAESVGRWIDSTQVKSPLSPFDIFSGQLSVRRSVFDELGGFDPGFTQGEAFGNEDADFGVRLLSRFQVKHNPAAISRQRYVVSHRDYMDRAERAVAADLRFIARHPLLARDLFHAKDFAGWRARLLYRPMSRMPLLAKFLSWAAVRLAEAADQTRLRSNRAIARFFSGARTLAYWSALRRAGWYPFSRRPLVLCYHAIEDRSDDPVLGPYCVPPELLAKQLDSLVDRGYTFINSDQLAAFLASDTPLPTRPVLLSFDDGYAGLISIYEQILQPRGIRPVVFAVTGMRSGTNEWDQPFGAGVMPLLEPAGLIGLNKLGAEIGAHSQTHAELPLLDPTAAAREAAGSAADLVALGLPAPRFFAYPYGYSDAAVREGLKQSAYTAAFGLAYDRISPESDRFNLPRVIVLANDGRWRFRFKTAAPYLWGKLLQAKALLKRMVELGASAP